MTFFEWHSAERHYALCHSAECYSAKCQGTTAASVAATISFLFNALSVLNVNVSDE